MSDDAVILAAMTIGHPDRFRILRACSIRPESPKTLASERQTVGQLSYHFRVLRDRGLIELMEVTRTRGSIQHWYVTTAKGKALLPPVAQTPA